MKKTKLKEVALCRDCGDTHVCQWCLGDGQLECEDTPRGRIECSKCCGTGKCPWCPEDGGQAA